MLLVVVLKNAQYDAIVPAACPKDMLTGLKILVLFGIMIKFSTPAGMKAPIDTGNTEREAVVPE
jgi:hypothetical protein